MAAIDRAELPESKSWSTGMAPAYIGTFLWVAFFDELGQRTLPLGGLGPTLLGVVAAAALAYLLLYRGPATWGFASRLALEDLAEHTFGRSGTVVVPDLLLGFAHVALFAVAIGYATDSMLGGLTLLGLIDPQVIRPILWERHTVPSPLFLTSALVWGTVTAVVGLGIVRWIAAIMQFFPVFPAAGLALAMTGSLDGLPTFTPSRIDPDSQQIVAADIGARLAFLAAFQWTFGFSALLGLTGATWGAASPTRLDVRNGGLVGIAVAPIIVASLALLTVAGYEGKLRDRAETVGTAEPGGLTLDPPDGPVGHPPIRPEPATANGRYSFRAAVEGSLDRRLAATVLIVFGLASLAPACYAAFEFGRRFSRIFPRFSRMGWTMVGVAAAWLLILGRWDERTDLVFSALGGLLVPVAGAMTANSARRRAEANPAPGRTARYNLAALLAWFVGASVGLAPLAGLGFGQVTLGRVPVPALLAFFAALLTYRLAAIVGLEPCSIPPADLSA